MSKNKKNNQSESIFFVKYRNPFTAICVGAYFGTLAVSIGAAIRNHDVRAEAINTLVGGSILGALTGTFGCILQNISNTSESTQICLGLMEFGLDALMILTTPLVGNAVLNTSTSWSEVVIDKFIGGSFLLANMCGFYLCFADKLQKILVIKERNEEVTTIHNSIQLNLVLP